MELFYVILQESHQSFGACEANRRVQGFFLFGQLLGFLYHLFWRTTSEKKLPAVWDSIHCFNFTRCSFLAITDVVKKSHFRTSALSAVKASVDVERQSLKRKTSSQLVTASVTNKNLTPYFESARNYLKFVYEGFRAHSLWKSDLVKSLASFDYSVFFLLPKEEAA